MLTVMFTCSMYDYVGEWPVRMDIDIYSPRLDVQGNSFRSIKACAGLAHELGLHTPSTS